MAHGIRRHRRRAASEVRRRRFTTSEFRDNRRVVVAPAQLFDVLESLKDERGFDMLVDLTAVDYLNYPDATRPLRRRLRACSTRRPASASDRQDVRSTSRT